MKLDSLYNIQLKINGYNWNLEDAMTKLEGTDKAEEIANSEEFKKLLVSIHDYTEYLRKLEGKKK